MELVTKEHIVFTLTVLLLAANVLEAKFDKYQKCIKHGKGCKDIGPFDKGKGRCGQLGPNMTCARIGGTCRCKSKLILNRRLKI